MKVSLNFTVSNLSHNLFFFSYSYILNSCQSSRMENDHLQIKDEGKETLSKEKPYIVLLLSVVMISVHIFRQSSRNMPI